MTMHGLANFKFKALHLVCMPSIFISVQNIAYMLQTED